LLELVFILLHFFLTFINCLFGFDDIVFITLLFKFDKARLLLLQFLLILKITRHDGPLFIIVLSKLNICHLIFTVQEIVGHERVLALTLVPQDLLKLEPEAHP
jgi:hypothetical protein